MSAMPQIDGTCLGEITIGENTYQKDIYILTNGAVTKRKKAIAREAYGTSHKIGPSELKKICKGHPKVIFVGAGHSGMTELTEEGRQFLEGLGIDCQVKPTPEIVTPFNQCEKPKAALIHVNC